MTHLIKMVLYGTFLGIPDAKMLLSQPNAFDQARYRGSERAMAEARNTASQWQGHPPLPFQGKPAVSMCTYDSECRHAPHAMCYSGDTIAPCSKLTSYCSAQWTCNN